VNGALTITDTLKIKGTETITRGSTVNNGTVVYYDNTTTALLNNFGTSFKNVTLGLGKTHNWTAGTTIAITGVFASNGTFASPALIRSSTPTVYALTNLSGSSTLGNKVDVQDNDAHLGNLINAWGSKNSGHNVNWLFASMAAMNYIVEEEED
jgi:hypothetical protein